MSERQRYLDFAKAEVTRHGSGEVFEGDQSCDDLPIVNIRNMVGQPAVMAVISMPPHPDRDPNDPHCDLWLADEEDFKS